MGQAVREASADVGFAPHEAITGGRRGKTAEAAARAEMVEQVQRLDALTERASVLRICKLGPKCVAAGLRRRGCFREIMAVSRFPPSGEAALARFAHFLVARIARQYLPHLEKSCVPTGQSISWETRMLTQSARVRAGVRMGRPQSSHPP